MQQSEPCQDAQPAQPINSYALVSYLPGPLGRFVDSLRRDLVQGCIAQSHVTILPPRPLPLPPETSAAQLRSKLERFQPFEIEITDIERFETTGVVYAAIGRGRQDLIDMHAQLNADAFQFCEPYPYHPHITLAQGIEPSRLDEIFEVASRRWREEAPARRFMVESLTFVRNTLQNRWLDLEDYELHGEPLPA
jgi:2'-5' RNA ligase